ncbi:MAG: hypothetical protein ACLFQM_08980 [Fidelibacterota bacterium]
MIKKVLTNIFSQEAMNIILPILLVQIILSLGTFKILKPHMRKMPCAVCGRANTTAKKSLWEFKTGVLKHKRIYYCQEHINKAPKIVQKLPSDNDTILKRYWLITAAGFLLFLSTIYSLALFDISMVYLILVPLIQLSLFLLKGIVTGFSIVFLFVSFLAAPVLFYYIWMNIETGNIKLKRSTKEET